MSLATIHSAKGLKFDTVYLIGLAEKILPSWHSINKSNGSAALEQERRGCFVAITRTKQHLILSRAKQYKGWVKQPSRFLREMGLLNGDTGQNDQPAHGEARVVSMGSVDGRSLRVVGRGTVGQVRSLVWRKCRTPSGDVSASGVGVVVRLVLGVERLGEVDLIGHRAVLHLLSDGLLFRIMTHRHDSTQARRGSTCHPQTSKK